ncbi:hypothetical protein NLJ89_g10000 [Agrocybe chaxingu]|uniref:Uncharacterized protein n=1 Tax=Agrocybe chaxingu TaxID=84603 RepID=A0A9W8MQP4_9AGAR|nr:hypothetical protein NLJ89_g10000 [Agrocybe chaxingu]
MAILSESMFSTSTEACWPYNFVGAARAHVFSANSSVTWHSRGDALADTVFRIRCAGGNLERPDLRTVKSPSCHSIIPHHYRYAPFPVAYTVNSNNITHRRRNASHLYF